MTTIEQLKLKNQTEIPIPKNGIIPEDKVINVQKKDDIDEFISNAVDTSNDGRFSSWQAAKNLGKGLISPITSIFSSIKGFLIGAGMIIGGAVLVAATGGGILPVFLAMGIAFGAYEGAKGIYKIITAKNGDDIEKAFLDFGTATSSIGLSFLGARTSLQAAGINTAGMSKTQSVISCFKELPNSIRNSYINIRKTSISKLFKKESANKIDPKEQAERKELVEKVKVIAEDMYDLEIKKMADRLGVPEEKLREVLPKIEYLDEIAGGLGAGGIKYTHKFSFRLSPNAVRDKSSMGYSPLEDTIHNIVAHECRHLEQRISAMMNLSRRDYIKAFQNSVTTVKDTLLKDKPFHKKCLFWFEAKTDPYLQLFSNTGRKISALKKHLNIPKDRQKGFQLVQEQFNNGKAHLELSLTYKRLQEEPLSVSAAELRNVIRNYEYANEEVDAIMYSMLSRLEYLVQKIKRPINRQGTDSPKDYGQRLFELVEEIAVDHHRYIDPQTKDLQSQLARIIETITTTRDILNNSRQLSPERTAIIDEWLNILSSKSDNISTQIIESKYTTTVSEVSQEEIALRFPGLLRSIDSLPE